jgi:L-threonylcarbamoyladenylate synthase
LVFDRKEGAVLDIVTAGQSTVAIRCPAHPWTQKILEQVGQPLVAPSANPFGKVSPTMAEHVLESFPHQDLLIFDGGRCQHGIESTIVSVTQSLPSHVLRPGAIEQQIIEHTIGISAHINHEIRVPGQLKQHYQPHKPMKAYETHQELLAAYLHAPKPHYVIDFVWDPAFDARYFYQWPDEPDALMYELYHQLRKADASDALAISVVLPPNEPRWYALRDRMIKASSWSI